MIAAQSKQDYKTMQIYQDSSMLLQGGPSCIVKKPEQPREYHEFERAVEVRAEKAAVKASGLGAGEFAMAQERVLAILRGGAPSDVSQSEQAAVSAKKAELEPLLGLEPEPAKAATTETGAPAVPASTAAPAVDPQAQAAAQDMSSCMMKNVQAHQAELEALGQRAQAAQKAGDQAWMIAIADTVQRIQMAGCTGH